MLSQEHRLAIVVTLTVAVGALGVFGAFGARAAYSAAGPVERFSAQAVSMGTVGTGANARVDIAVERWSTDAERERLIKAFVEKGANGLLDELQKSKRVGFIRYPSSMLRYWGMSALGYDLRFAREVPGEDGGRRIILATDRYIGPQEAMNRPRTIDYPFTLIEIHLNKNGEGEGKMSIATKITFNKKDNLVELENYSSEPVRLLNLKKEAAAEK